MSEVFPVLHGDQVVALTITGDIIIGKLDRLYGLFHISACDVIWNETGAIHVTEPNRILGYLLA